jgi:hypothetical protein
MPPVLEQKKTLFKSITYYFPPKYQQAVMSEAMTRCAACAHQIL